MIRHRRGRATTLVASSRPPSPTSSSTQSAGVSAKARKAAAVVISKKVIGAPALAASQRSRQRGQPVLVDRRAGEPDALVEAHQMGRDVDVDPLAAGLAASPPASPRAALAVGAGDMDHRRQAALGMAQRCQQPLDPAEREVDDLGVQRVQAGEDQVTGGARHAPRPHGPRAGVAGRRRHLAGRRAR